MEIDPVESENGQSDSDNQINAEDETQFSFPLNSYESNVSDCSQNSLRIPNSPNSQFMGEMVFDSFEETRANHPYLLNEFNSDDAMVRITTLHMPILRT